MNKHPNATDGRNGKKNNKSLQYYNLWKFLN